MSRVRLPSGRAGAERPGRRLPALTEGADRAGPASECAAMPEEIHARLDQLSAAFARLADRTPWVRASFTVNGGRFGLFGFGRPGGDGDTEAILIAERDPFLSELHALTDQAGSLKAEMLLAR